MKNKTIVVPIDFSKDSMLGLKFAMVFAKKIKADICMVYVQKKSTTSHLSSLLEESKWAKYKFEEIIEKYSSKLKENNIYYKIRKGKVYEEVVNQAVYSDAYMIICATHGASGFEEMFIGSNAFKIVSAAQCPVISVRKTYCPSEINKIILPISLSAETRQKVPFVCELAKIFDSEVHAVIVNTSPSKVTTATLNNYLNQVKNYLNKHDIKYKTALVEGSNFSDLTLKFANKVGADLIATVTEHGGLMNDFFIGPFAHQMVNHSNLPVLSINSKKTFDIDAFKY